MSAPHYLCHSWTDLCHQTEQKNDDEVTGMMCSKCRSLKRDLSRSSLDDGGWRGCLIPLNIQLSDGWVWRGGDMRPTGGQSVPPGSQKADPQWAGRRSGKAPWKIPLAPQKPQERHLLPWLNPPSTSSAPGYISVSLSTASFSKILPH